MEIIKSELDKLSDKEKAKIYQGYFKTGKGQYGEGDIFIGISTPMQRKIAKKYSGLSIPKIQQLIKSEIHEHRSVALFILIEKYKKANDRDKEDIFSFYLKNTKHINNWDLVDISAPNIVGDFLFNKKKKILYDLANSKNLWEKRIAIVSTWTLIRNEDFDDALRVSEILLGDSHDLIHKAVGWMLREVGKRDEKVLKDFLRDNYDDLPRTTLRYAIERFDEDERKKWLKSGSAKKLS